MRTDCTPILTWFARAGITICLVVWAIVAVPRTSYAQNPPTPLPPTQKAVNYAEPRREYETIHAGYYSFEVELQLIKDDPALTKRALARLVEKLSEALKALPSPARPVLYKLTYFLMYGPKSRFGGRDNGLEYFQRNAPTYHKELDPRWSSSIVIYSAENYVQISDLWALKALVHELAHAYQLEQWPETQPDILRAWKNATNHGLYQGVKDDQGKIIDKAYAAVNQLEYFAELSCMYFARCNYQPFDRLELRNYDPVGLAMIEKIWGLRH